MESIITKCNIEVGKLKNKVNVTYDGGFSCVLFTYYNDELKFRSDEFIGLTTNEALDVYHTKDIAYLRS